MLALVLRGVAFAHAGGEPLFSDVDLRLARGAHGLVGANGAGKTTLLRLLSGDLSPTSGTVRVEPVGARIALCPQVVDAVTPPVDALAKEASGAARALRYRLGLDRATLERWPTLSPGERKRWQIGAAIFEAPDVLLLDEPTNHIDAKTRELLVSELRRFGGVIVLVAHDRALLDALTISTVRVHVGRATHHAGSISEAREAWDRDREARGRERGLAVEAARRAARHVEAKRREHASAARNLSTSARMKGPRDHDATGFGGFRTEKAEARLSRRVGVARADAARALARVEPFEVDKVLGRSVFVGYEPPPRARLLAFEGDVFAGEHACLQGVRLDVPRGARIRVEGPNGAGKTSLVSAMLRGAALPKERVLELPQELSPEEGRAILEAARRLPPASRGRMLGLVAALGVDPDRLLASREPSPGEARKLCIAKGLAQNAWLAVLDEPTNHLDLPSIERLERALVAFPGALVVVSHDPTFLAGSLETRWRVEDGRVEVGCLES